MSDREYMRIHTLSNDNITSVTNTTTTQTVTTATITNATITNLNGTALDASTAEINRLDDDHTQENFVQGPMCQVRGGGAATGTAGDENQMNMGLNLFEYHILGTQTIVAPVPDALGLNVGLDQTENDGAEFTMGIDAGAKHAFTVGTTPAFYAKASFKIPNVSGTDDFAFGFRKAEVYQANLDDYDEAACLNVISGDIKIETILNGGGTTTTDTTDNWADNESHSLEVYVSLAGAVTYKIDGAAPTTTAAFSFDATEVVVPFFYYLHAAAPVAGAIIWKSFECGLQ
jgi:hypothetical protein